VRVLSWGGVEATSLTYLICRVHGYETRLIKPDRMLELASLGSLEDLVRVLDEADYGRYLSGAKTLGEVERGLAEAFISKLKPLLELASGGMRKLLEAYLGKYEVLNLTWSLRMRAGGAPREMVELILLPTWRLGGIDLKPILEAENIEVLKKTIQQSGAYEISEDVGDLLQLEAELWRSHHQRVFKLVSMTRISDSGEVRRFLGIELELSNLRTCMLALLRNWDPGRIRGLLADNPAGTSSNLLQELVEKRDPRIFMERFKMFRSFLEKAASGDVWLMEIEALKIVKRYVDSERISKFISFFYILRYILELEIEYRNLRAIAVATHHNLPHESRRMLLILD
jgi:vacuolar-type H+-ATPase subunit C/Vma6